MGKKNDAFLLSDGDRLRLSSKTTLIFRPICEAETYDFDLIQEKDMRVCKGSRIMEAADFYLSPSLIDML